MPPLPLRDYQEIDIKKTWDYMQRGIRRGIIHYATGGGKTITGIEFNKRYFPPAAHRSIFVAKDRELIFQPYRVYKSQWPEVSAPVRNGTAHVPGLGMAMANEKHNAPHARVIVGSVPTLIDRSDEPINPIENWKTLDGKRLPQAAWSGRQHDAYEAYLVAHEVWARQYALDMAPITLDDITYKQGHIHLSSQSHRTALVSTRMDEILAHGHLSLMIYDECHHSVSDQSLVLLKRLDEIHTVLGLPLINLLGFTATPLRADNRALSNAFDWIYASRSFRWMQQHGYLADFAPPLRAKILISNTETKQVKYIDNWAEQVVETWLEKGENRPTIAYVGALGELGAIEASKRLRDVFSVLGVTAAHIDGTGNVDVNGQPTKKEKRQEIFDAFQAGEIKVLTNYGVLIEGVDLPIASCMLLARPANALTLTQMIGRTIRLHPSKKDALMIDFTGGDLTVITAGTLMGYRIDPATGEYVEELLEEDEEDEASGDVRETGQKGKYVGEGRVYEVAKILSHSTGDWFRDDNTDILSMPLSEADVLVITPPHYGRSAVVEMVLKEAQYAFMDEALPWTPTPWEQKRYNTFKAMKPEQLEQYVAVFEWIKELYGNFVLWHVNTDSQTNKKDHGKGGSRVVGRGYITVNPALDVLENEAIQYGYSLPQQGDWAMKKGKTWKYKTLQDYPLLAQKLQSLLPKTEIVDMTMRAGHATKLISHLLSYHAVNAFYAQADQQLRPFIEPQS